MTEFTEIGKSKVFNVCEAGHRLCLEEVVQELKYRKVSDVQGYLLRLSQRFFGVLGINLFPHNGPNVEKDGVRETQEISHPWRSWRSWR